MDLTTRYLGLTLANPIMPGASPLPGDLDTVKRLEDAGASAIVMNSLFEEQLALEQMAGHRLLDGHDEGYAEALSYFPTTSDYKLDSDAYLEQIRKIRAAVSVPVIGSLNGVSLGGWVNHARSIQEAGAHALELNMYELAADPSEDAAALEARQLRIVRAVLAGISIPVAVKLSPFYSALPSFVRALEEAGVGGVVLFNRLYQPDIDPENLELARTLHLSTSSELPMRLRWLAILSPHARLSLAASGGVHEPLDAVKALMAGATTVQLVSSLLRHGPGHLKIVLDGLRAWLEEHEYESAAQLRGSMNHARCPNPGAYERGNYVQLLQSWHGQDVH